MRATQDIISGFAKIAQTVSMNAFYSIDHRPLQLVRPDFPMVESTERQTRMFMGRGNTDVQFEVDAYLEVSDLDKMKKKSKDVNIQAEYFRVIELGLIQA